MWMGLQAQITVVPHSSSVLELLSGSFVVTALKTIISLTEDLMMSQFQLMFSLINDFFCWIPNE
jgi:hypothetical protein